MFDQITYIDFHRHSGQSTLENSISIQSIDLTEKESSSYFTIGKHPWKVDRLLRDVELLDLENRSKSASCLALGEMGLDKLHLDTFEVQMSVFVQQLEIADRAQKPVIIHCVKAFDELLVIKNQFPSIDRWAIHGFNKNIALANQLINAGFYISINPLKIKRAAELISALPLDRLFLETDDSLLSIADAYIRTSEILGIEVSELSLQMNKNAQTFFKK